MDPSRYLTRLRSGVELPPAMAPSWQAPTYDSAPKTRSDWVIASHIPLRNCTWRAEARHDRVMAVTAVLERESAASPLPILPRSWAQTWPRVEMWERLGECWGQGRTSHLHTSTLHIDLPPHKHTHTLTTGREEERSGELRQAGNTSGNGPTCLG